MYLENTLSVIKWLCSVLCVRSSLLHDLTVTGAESHHTLANLKLEQHLICQEFSSQMTWAFCECLNAVI